MLSPRFLLAVTLAAVLGCAGFFYRSVDGLVAEARDIYASMDARQAVAELQSTLLNAETGQRGFLITSEELYLDPYLMARQAVADKLLSLDRKLQGDPVMIGLKQRLAKLSFDKLSELEATVAVHRRDGTSASAPFLAEGTGRHIMDDVRRSSTELKRRLDDRIAASKMEFQADRRNLVLGGAGLGITALTLLGLLVRLRHRDLQESGLREQQSRELAALMRELAIRDALTGVHNRRHLSEIGPQLVAEAARTGSALTAVMLDIDHFKSLNDMHGHAVGDRVLGLLGRRLVQTLKSGEWVFRYGGEEFVILLLGSSLEAVAERMDGLRRQLSDDALDDGGAGSPRITISVGVAAFRGEGETLEELMGAADAALFVSKRNGRNRISMADRIAA